MLQLDTTAIALLLPIFGLLIAFINLQRDVDRGELSTTNTRIIVLAIGLGVILLLISVKPFYWSVILSIIFVVPLGLLILWVNRRGAQTKDWNDEIQLARLHMLESNQTQSLLVHLIQKAEGKATNFPSINEAVSVLFGLIERILLSAHADMEIKMSLLRPQVNGKFEVIAINRNVSLTAKDTMTEKLQWSPSPKGVAGHAIAKGDTIRFANIDTDDENHIWERITNPSEKSIMCIPIKNQQVEDTTPRDKAFLAVLCISCSEKHSLTAQHETIFKKIFIPSFAYIMLFYILFDKLDSN